MKLKREKCSAGKYDVVTCPPYPRRVGFIIGASGHWTAERGPKTLGVFPTLNKAMQAIGDAEEGQA